MFVSTIRHNQMLSHQTLQPLISSTGTGRDSGISLIVVMTGGVRSGVGEVILFGLQNESSKPYYELDWHVPTLHSSGLKTLYTQHLWTFCTSILTKTLAKHWQRLNCLAMCRRSILFGWLTASTSLPADSLFCAT